MNLMELFEALVSSFKMSQLKDIKSAVRMLARSLGFADAAKCPPEAYNRPVAQIMGVLEDYLSGKGKHVVRNARNNVSRLYRIAIEQGVLVPSTTIISPRYDVKKRKLRPGSESVRHRGYYLKYDLWPEHAKRDFEDFREWSTKAFVSGRDAKCVKVAVTVNNYKHACAAYFGWMVNIEKISVEELSFDLLFEVKKVEAFASWHINQLHKRPTEQLHKIIKCIRALSKSYRRLPQVVEQINKLLKSIPKPNPVYKKEDALVPLKIIDEIGMSLWPQQPPMRGGKGRKQASNAVKSLMLQLWACRPYRQRNIREMELDENLYKDKGGRWRIRFVAEGLKIKNIKGRINYFELTFPLHLEAKLEEYLNVWRPLLVKEGATCKHVFVNNNGMPYTMNSLHDMVVNLVYRYVGGYFHPHIIRTAFTTEYIKDTGNIFQAAIMLNDTVETVLNNYTYMVDDSIAEEVDDWFAECKAASRSPSSRPAEEARDLAGKFVKILFDDPTFAAFLLQQPHLREDLLKKTTVLVLNHRTRNSSKKKWVSQLNHGRF